AVVLGLLGALGEFDAAFARVRLGTIACAGLLPGVDLLGGRFLDRLARRRSRDDGQLLGGGFHQRATDRLGLEERPHGRGFRVVAERCRLRALAQRLRERQAQSDDGDQQGDLLVAAFEDRLFLVVPVPVLHLVLGLVLYGVHAMAHVALLRFMLPEDVVTRVPSQGLPARRPAAQRGRRSRGARRGPIHGRYLRRARRHARELSGRYPAAA